LSPEHLSRPCLLASVLLVGTPLSGLANSNVVDVAVKAQKAAQDVNIKGNTSKPPQNADEVGAPEEIEKDKPYEKIEDAKASRKTPEERIFIAKVCTLLQSQAVKWKLPPGYFARLIWLESGFNPNAISYKGAQGIAQFIPSTARIRGLKDAFDFETALRASAEFLSDLRDDSGNLGLAAASYNAGSKRVERWRKGRSFLPLETKNYVRYITGFKAREWKKSKLPEPTYILKQDTSFQQACQDLPINLSLPQTRYAKGHYNKGIVHYNKGLYGLAITRYSTAITLYPRYFKAYYNRAIAYYKNKQYDRAITDYDRVIQLKSNYAAAYNNRGVVYRKKRDYDTAIADFNTAIRLNPRYSKAFYNRAIGFYKKGDFERAIVDYSRAIKIYPKYAAAHNNRAVAYHKVNKYSLAISDYNEVIKLNPKYAAAYLNRGVAYRKKGNFKLALADYTFAIKLNPTRASAFGQRGSAYIKLGERTKAIADFRRAIELNPGNRRALAGLKILGVRP
jgi:tetratricopeptide (TPR) repeat protein